MNKSKRVWLPQMEWYGDTELEIDFPDSWEVKECRMHGHAAPPLSDAGFRKALANPIGTKTIKELAKGNKEVVILFDDMSRATPTAVMIPYVLEELAAAGIADDSIRLVDGASRLIEILEGAGIADEFLVEMRGKIDGGKYSVMGDKDEFIKFLDDLTLDFADKLKSEGGA